MIRFIAVILPFAILLLIPARADAQACAPNSSRTAAGTCACNRGYTGDGRTCVEIDACALHPCDKNAICSKTGPGTVSCACKAGYRGNGRTCVEINACISHPCGKDATCQKTGPGTYSCTCKAGYVGNGITCVLPR